MKFEEVLPLMREGKKFKCGDQEGCYLLVRNSIFDTYLGESIYCWRNDPNLIEFFEWGVSGYSLLSEEWEVTDKEIPQEIYKIESTMKEAIESTIFNYFLSITKAFTPEGALLPPLAKPMAAEIFDMLKKFFDIKRIG